MSRLDDQPRHIYVGMSLHLVWCQVKLGNRRHVSEMIASGRLKAPATEGEVRDGVVAHEDVCESCFEALREVRPT